MHRMRVYTTEAIVLKRHNLGEADRIVTLYTPLLGKLRAVAKGARRPTSRLAGHLELFSLSMVQLAHGRELEVVTQAETRDAFRAVRDDLSRTTQAYCALELVDRLTPDRLENAAVFDLLHELFTGLSGPRPSTLALPYFLVHTLAALGYRPQLRQCVVCRGTIVPGVNYFSQALGGVLCPTCGPAEPTAQSIPLQVLKALRYLQRTPLLADLRVAVTAEIAGGAEAVLRAYGEYLLEHRLHAGEFMDRLRMDSRMQAEAVVPSATDEVVDPAAADEGAEPAATVPAAASPASTRLPAASVVPAGGWP
jgi:DNA repair protein RecO (recombination protein O)